MGLYVQGVDMPEKYPICLVVWPDGRTEKYAAAYVDSTKTGECEAVQVPPHGRLGDLDVLAWQFTPDDMYYPTEEDKCEYDSHCMSLRDVRGNIAMAQTIIPADCPEKSASFSMMEIENALLENEINS